MPTKMLISISLALILNASIASASAAAAAAAAAVPAGIHLPDERPLRNAHGVLHLIQPPTEDEVSRALALRSNGHFTVNKNGLVFEGYLSQAVQPQHVRFHGTHINPLQKRHQLTCRYFYLQLPDQTEGEVKAAEPGNDGTYLELFTLLSPDTLVLDNDSGSPVHIPIAQPNTSPKRGSPSRNTKFKLKTIQK